MTKRIIFAAVIGVFFYSMFFLYENYQKFKVLSEIANPSSIYSGMGLQINATLDGYHSVHRMYPKEFKDIYSNLEYIDLILVEPIRVLGLSNIGIKEFADSSVYVYFYGIDEDDELNTMLDIRKLSFFRYLFTSGDYPLGKTDMFDPCLYSNSFRKVNIDVSREVVLDMTRYLASKMDFNMTKAYDSLGIYTSFIVEAKSDSTGNELKVICDQFESEVTKKYVEKIIEGNIDWDYIKNNVDHVYFKVRR
ncbi:MAG: hypothetical protein ACJA2S_005284, partial [Cyclobacteriaceae bacterium]